MSTRAGTDHPLAAVRADLVAAPRVWVAYSGGMDSTLLLHLVRDLLPPEKMVALHVNHGIHSQADQWQAACTASAAELGVHLQAFRIELDGSANLEAEARRARYQVFERCLGPGEVLLMAHHANDQAETLMLRMMRGAGWRGMGGMPPLRALGQGVLLRPLLARTREELQKMALARQIDWIEDPSNQDRRRSRNFLRYDIMPLLSGRWPAAVQRMQRTAATLQEAQQLLACYAGDLIRGCNPQDEAFGSSLELARFNTLTESQRQLVLRHLLATYGEHPEHRRLRELLRQLQQHRAGAGLSQYFGSAQLHCFRERLYLLRAVREPNPQEIYGWDGGGVLEIPGIGVLSWPDLKPEGESFQVGFRRGGERCHPLQRAHSQTLKHLFQEYAVPPWLRTRTPVIYRGRQLVAVAGLFSCAADLPKPSWIWQGSSERPR